MWSEKDIEPIIHGASIKFLLKIDIILDAPDNGRIKS